MKSRHTGEGRYPERRALTLNGITFNPSGFPLPVSHARVSECGNPIPHSAISAPSAVTPSNLTAKNAWPTMSVSRKRSPADTPRPAKPCETNRERHRGKSEHAKSSQTVSPPRRLSGASPRIRFNTPLPNGSSGARQFENGRKTGRSDRVSNCLIFSNCLAPEPSPSYSSFPRKDAVEKPSYRRRPVSRGAGANFERHHFQSLRFPLPVSHARVSECGNPIPHSAISAPSAVNPRTEMRGRESTRFNRLQYGNITALTGLE